MLGCTVAVLFLGPNERSFKPVLIADSLLFCLSLFLRGVLEWPARNLVGGWLCFAAAFTGVIAVLMGDGASLDAYVVILAMVAAYSGAGVLPGIGIGALLRRR